MRKILPITSSTLALIPRALTYSGDLLLPSFPHLSSYPLYLSLPEDTAFLSLLLVTGSRFIGLARVGKEHFYPKGQLSVLLTLVK